MIIREIKEQPELLAALDAGHETYMEGYHAKTLSLTCKQQLADVTRLTGDDENCLSLEFVLNDAVEASVKWEDMTNHGINRFREIHAQLRELDRAQSALFCCRQSRHDPSLECSRVVLSNG